tara:strand:- start:968 stop:1264 length:297 start_codon:yes stop_codon:yes gene_type:complete
MSKIKYSPKFIKIRDLEIRETTNTIDNPKYKYDWDGLKEDLLKDGLQECIHVEYVDTKYHLINGSHRIQILRRLYGDALEVPIRIQSNSEKYRPEHNG